MFCRLEPEPVVILAPALALTTTPTTTTTTTKGRAQFQSTAAARHHAQRDQEQRGAEHEARFDLRGRFIYKVLCDDVREVALEHVQEARGIDAPPVQLAAHARGVVAHARAQRLRRRVQCAVQRKRKQQRRPVARAAFDSAAFVCDVVVLGAHSAREPCAARGAVAARALVSAARGLSARGHARISLRARARNDVAARFRAVLNRKNARVDVFVRAKKGRALSRQRHQD